MKSLLIQLAFMGADWRGYRELLRLSPDRGFQGEILRPMFRLDVRQ